MLRAEWRRWRRALTRALPWTAAMLWPGCASYRGYQGPQQVALERDPARPSALDRRADAASAGHAAGESGVVVLASGEEALYARLGLIETAERSIDLQVYIWDLDTSGNLVLARLLAAADRGVRVRLLLDDTATFAGERAFAAPDRHPNVDVRLFNPFRTRSTGTWPGRALEFLFDFRRLNRRMHNKLWLADGAFAIVGGRNVADHYFLIAEDLNFRDLDLLIAGSAARACTESFDRYWNSRWSVPIARLNPARDVRLGRLRERLAAHEASQSRIPYPRPVDAAHGERMLDRIAPRFTWAPVQLLADEPEKIESGGPSAIAERLREAAAAVRRELIVEVAYLALPRESTDRLAALVERGVSVRVLTNSLATNDVLAAHAGYVPTRRRLLEAGVELHELRPGGHERGRLLRPPRRSRASLHSKAVVFDRERVYVGSLNLDPRSVVYNTETGLLVTAPAVAAEVVRRFEEGWRPEHSWELRRVGRRVRTGDGRALEATSVVWVGRDAEGREVVRTREPRASFWRRLAARLLGLLPLEGQV
jgi:putative cardiolipin synthase